MNSLNSIRLKLEDTRTNIIKTNESISIIDKEISTLTKSLDFLSSEKFKELCKQKSVLKLQYAIRKRQYQDGLENCVIDILCKVLGYEKSTMTTSVKEMVKSIGQNIDEIRFLEMLEKKAFTYIENQDLIHLTNMMKMKSKGTSCQSAIKMLIYTKDEASLKQMTSSISKHSQKIYRDLKKTEKTISLEDVKKILGYILTLNFNTLSYFETLTSQQFKLNLNYDKFKQYSNEYLKFVKIDHLAKKNPEVSQNRRSILNLCNLLETHLQRDPEEAFLYDAQMASAEVDKAQLLIDLDKALKTLQPLTVIDIGPAGGATFKSIVTNSFKKVNNQIGYIGIEFDNKELHKLNDMLSDFQIKGKRASDILQAGAQFIKGNALELDKIIKTMLELKMIKDEPLSIVLSSVIHEIYSYCSYTSPTNHCNDIVTMIQPNDQNRYNPETVYKIYEEALLALSQNKGSLNIRDGVMYHRPEEIVTFSLNDESWRLMFKAFIQDSKYNHLNDGLKSKGVDINNLSAGTLIQLPAKYVQEFMLKANWGPQSFGNEINEVYCYMRLKDHIKLIKRAAIKNNIDIEIEIQKSYTQEGYKTHINSSKIEIKDGFGPDKFPPTNFVIKVKLKDRERVPVYSNTKYQAN